MSKPPKICVIGAGIIGLSTAVALQSTIKYADVTVMADRFSPNLTSDVAAGFWSPHVVGETPVPLVRRWGGATYERMHELFMSESCSETGVTQLSGYCLFTTKGNDLNPHWKDIVGNFSVLSASDMKQFPGFPGFQEGMFFTSYLCEPTVYMKLLSKQFKEGNGRFIQRRLSTLEEVGCEFDVIVNCSGIGSHQLVGDTLVQPIRGQVIQVKAPWIKCFYVFNGDTDAYILPGVTKVTVGGTHQASNWDTGVSENDTREIWSNACARLPSLKNAEKINIVSGLRPSRQTVRLERGTDVIHNGKKIPVIHNYGHGGAGVTLHYGCASHATELVVKALQNGSHACSATPKHKL